MCQDHGYLAGEQYTCPHCGRKTEVYSRITGYYRPVQNWNDGKAQEFRDRKVYDLGTSHTPHGTTAVQPADEASQPDFSASAAVPTAGGKRVLFTTKTCPNCKVAGAMLEKAGLPFETADAQDNRELVGLYEIKQAPTLVVLQGDHCEKFVNLSNIKRYVETARA